MRGGTVSCFTSLLMLALPIFRSLRRRQALAADRE
jgi:hypothetical protein